MTKYVFQVQQMFDCTYDVEADSSEEAWEKLLANDVDSAECYEQVPGEICEHNTMAGSLTEVI